MWRSRFGRGYGPLVRQNMEQENTLLKNTAAVSRLMLQHLARAVCDELPAVLFLYTLR